MVKKLIHECDMCGERSDLPPFGLVTGRSMDSAGSMEDEYEEVDLCTSCVSSVIIHFINEWRRNNDYEQAKWFVKEFKTRWLIKEK